jgi:hypothetical protein
MFMVPWIFLWIVTGTLTGVMIAKKREAVPAGAGTPRPLIRTSDKT